MIRMIKFLGRFRREEGGSLLVETAITLSIILSLTMSGVEIARYALLHQKLERVVASTGDLIAQAPFLSETDVNNVFSAIVEVAKPFTMGAEGVVIISSVSCPTGGGCPPEINWQRTGGGSLSAVSQVGTTGGAATMPAGMTVIPGETVIVAEVYFNFQPWIFPDVITSQQLYHSAYFRPRLGTLTTIIP